MPIIIQKPTYFRKNEANTIRISKTALKAIPKVSAHPHFRKVKNWMDITFNYKSVPENQLEVVLFDATQVEPEGVLEVSPKALNNFQIDSIVFHDFDLGWLTVFRDELDISEFDFIFDSRLYQPELSAVIQNKSNVLLNWTQADETDGTTDYNVYRKIGNGSFTQLTTVTGSLTYTDTGLLPDTTYTYKVEIPDLVKYLPADDLEAITTARPAIPQNLTASSTSGQVTLNWEAIAGSGITYRVFRSLTSGGQTTPIISGLTGTTYIDSTVTDGILYYYTVRSYDGFESFDSNEVQMEPMGNFSLSSVEKIDVDELRATWTSAAGADSYNLLYRPVSGVMMQITNAVSPQNIIGLLPDTDYEVYIRAVNSTFSKNSNTITTRTPFIPAIPTGLVGTSYENQQTNLSWNAMAGADSYEIWRRTTGSLALIGTSATPSFNNTGLVNGTTYYYAVKSVNVDGSLTFKSALSGEVNVLPNNVGVVSSYAIPAGAWPAGNQLINFSTVTTNILAASISSIEIRYFNSAGALQGSSTSGAGVTTHTTPTFTVPLNTQYAVYSIVSLTDGQTIQGQTVYLRTAPEKVTNLAQNMANTNLSWTAAVNANKYRVFRSTTTTFSTTPIATVTTTSYTSVNSEILHYWTVKGFNDSAWTGVQVGNNAASSVGINLSEQSNITTNQPIAGVDLFTPATQQIRVDWTNVHEANAGGALRIYVKNQSNPFILLQTIINPASTGQFTDSVINGDYNEYKLEYTNNAGRVSGASYIFGNPNFDNHAIAAIGNAVGSVTVNGSSSNAGDRVSLSWPAVDGASHYSIYARKTTGGIYRTATTTSTSGTIDGLTPDTVNFFVVEAGTTKNGSNHATDTAARKFPEVSSTPVTNIIATGTVTVTGYTTTSVSLSWPVIANATVYFIEYGTSPGVYNIGSGSSLTNSVVVTDLIINTQYFFRVSGGYFKNSLATSTGSAASRFPEVTETPRS